MSQLPPAYVVSYWVESADGPPVDHLAGIWFRREVGVEAYNALPEPSLSIVYAKLLWQLGPRSGSTPIVGSMRTDSNVFHSDVNSLLFTCLCESLKLALAAYGVVLDDGQEGGWYQESVDAGFRPEQWAEIVAALDGVALRPAAQVCPHCLSPLATNVAKRGQTFTVEPSRRCGRCGKRVRRTNGVI